MWQLNSTTGLPWIVVRLANPLPSLGGIRITRQLRALRPLGAHLWYKKQPQMIEVSTTVRPLTVLEIPHLLRHYFSFQVYTNISLLVQCILQIMRGISAGPIMQLYNSVSFSIIQLSWQNWYPCRHCPVSHSNWHWEQEEASSWKQHGWCCRGCKLLHLL